MKKVEVTENRMKEYYDQDYKSKSSPRYFWEGRVGVEYKVPKYISLLLGRLKNKKNLRILEIGAGSGETYKLIKKSGLDIKEYVATEILDTAVKRLKKKKIKAYNMDAMDLKFDNNSFDLVLCFDVMHHVMNPRKMAQEMVRVSKKYVFLCEANGISLLRRILELTPRNRRANENSYFPWVYKNFFKGVRRIEIKPFSYIFAHTPDLLFKPYVKLSEFLECVPFIRWQGSSVMIYAEKK